MAWFSGKVSLGNFPDLAGAVNKLSESVKNIEKNFDTALGFEDKSDSSTSTEASGLWPVMSLMGHVSEDSTVESSEKTVSPQKSSSVEEKESQNPDTEQTTALEEIQMLDTKKDGEHLEIAEKKDDVISDSGKTELESNLQPEPKAAERPEPVVHDVKIPDSVDELQGKEILKAGHAENPDTLEIKLEAPRVDEVEASSILHNKSHEVFHTESHDDQETQAVEIVEQSSIQAEASSDTQAEALDDVQAEASTDILAEASNDNRAVASSGTQAEAAVDSSSSQPICSEVSSRAHGLSLSTASPSDEASEMVSGPVSKADDGNDQTVGGDKGVNEGEVGSKEQCLSSGLSISDSTDFMLELEKVKTEMKMMETALQGAARQAQAKADEIAKLMNENEHLKVVIRELKRKSNDAEIDSLREEYHQRVSTLERKHSASESLKGVSMDHIQKIGVASRLVYGLTKERDTLKREQNKKSDAAALLKEKDEIINQVMAEALQYEGEELSKKQAVQESTIRKLRSQMRELEEEKKGLMTKVQVEENKVESIKKDKTATENLLQETIEKHHAELSAQKEYYMDALSASKKAEALAEARADNEARTELESLLREAEERETMLVQALEELRQTLNRKEQQAVFREDMLCRDIEDLQKRYQASERRCEELITQVPDSTRPLLRQIEAMQETTARRAEAWAAVERSLNSRRQEAETKAAVAEEREQSVNQRLSQTLSRINVLEAQISCLRTEQTQLSLSLYIMELLKITKEEADTQECRANQLEAQIKELRQQHKEELQDALTHRELLQQEIEREKAARLDLERTARVHSTSASDQTPIARSNSAFENGNLTRKLSTASSLGSMEESYYLQASLDTSENLFERRNFGEATMSPYYMKSMTPSTFESALRQKEGELASYMSRLASMESVRDSLAEELVKMTSQCEKLRAESSLLPGVRAELDALRQRHSAALELMGERDEELEELRADIVDLKEMYREQVNLLVNKVVDKVNFAMRGRYAETVVTKKRASSRDFINAYDREESSGHLAIGTAKDAGNPHWRHSLVHVLVATISSFLFGYHLGVVNETLESISFDLGFSGNTMAEGLVVSTCLGGAFVGSVFSGWIADGVGRRRAFQLCALPMIIGASMSATTKDLWGMLLGRFFVGTGMGISPPVAALYVTEVSPAYVRGTYGSLTQISTCLGLMGSLLIGIPAKETMGWWRICFWVSVIPAAMLAVFMEFCAESPHWLLKKGRSTEAEAQFEKLFGGSHVKTAIIELSKSGRGDEVEVKLSEFLFGRYFKVVFIGSALFALQQLSGINAVFYFSSAVFKSAGVPSDSANICVGICNLLGSIIAMIMMDKLGRKVLLTGSFFGMNRCDSMLDLYFMHPVVQAVSMGLQAIAATSFVSSFAALYLSVGGMLLFVLMFSLGAGPVPSLLLSEILPGRIRAKALAVCMAVHWVINFFVGLLFLRLLEQIGPLVLYTVFGSFCLVAVFFVKKNVLETKGKSLQEIEIALMPPE
ncbi:hypothetical protein SADUNF_Sadunf01G0163600 [Salix dunnii]|uniref:Major facilitator superfamily (MFS) profile domain-containing protein n=1 Tax=Salix dunnii TaxID=1413687 RepID=A0A835NC54_9ROSI|nr:hypothetical protein SADUNF_Sadunf01G0163600 [Salix dunnii]